MQHLRQHHSLGPGGDGRECGHIWVTEVVRMATIWDLMKLTDSSPPSVTHVYVGPILRLLCTDNLNKAKNLIFQTNSKSKNKKNKMTND